MNEIADFMNLLSANRQCGNSTVNYVKIKSTLKRLIIRNVMLMVLTYFKAMNISHVITVIIISLGWINLQTAKFSLILLINSNFISWKAAICFQLIQPLINSALFLLLFNLVFIKNGIRLAPLLFLPNQSAEV